MKYALYRWYDEAGDLLYVGISGNLWARTKQHSKSSTWFEQIAHCRVEWFNTEREAARAEYKAIKTEKPMFNKRFNQIDWDEVKLLDRLADWTIFERKGLISSNEAIALRASTEWLLNQHYKDKKEKEDATVSL